MGTWLAPVRGRFVLAAGVLFACLVVLVGPSPGLATPSFDYSTNHGGVMDLVGMYATGSTGSLSAVQQTQFKSMQWWSEYTTNPAAVGIESTLAKAADADAAVPDAESVLDGAYANGAAAAVTEGSQYGGATLSSPLVVGYSIGSGQYRELRMACSVDGVLGGESCGNLSYSGGVVIDATGQLLWNANRNSNDELGYLTEDPLPANSKTWVPGFYFDTIWCVSSTCSPYAGFGNGTGQQQGTLYMPDSVTTAATMTALPSSTSYPQMISAYNKINLLPVGGWNIWDRVNYTLSDACQYDFGSSAYVGCASWVTPASALTLQIAAPPTTVSSSTLTADGGLAISAPSPLTCADGSACYTAVKNAIDASTTTKEWIEYVLDPTDFPTNPLVAAIPDAQTRGSSGPSLTNSTTSSQGEPVDTATGNFYSSTVDVSLPGIGVPFTFTRSYNSANTASGRLGTGWTDNLDWSISIDGSGNATVDAGSGQQIKFTASGGNFVPDPGVTATLASMSGGYKLVTHDQTTYSFNSSGLLTAIKDRNSQGITLTYTSGVLSSVTDSVGRTITFTTTSGHLTGISLPDGRDVAYGYTSSKLTSFTDLNGHTVSYGYDTNGLLNQITDQNGNTVIANVYDATSHRVTEQTDGRGHHSYFSWNATTQTSTYTDARGKTWTDVYDGNVLQSETDPDSDTTSYYYDSNDNLIAVTDPNGNTTTYTYDTAGNKLSETAPSPLSYVQSWTYNAKNDVTSYTNGDGNTTSYAYNTAGDLTTVTGPDPDGAGAETAPVTTYGRDATTGQVTSVTDPRGKETDYGYDGDGNLTSVTSPEGEETTYGYDSGGRMTSKVEARGNVSGCSCASSYTWSYTYDDANHMLTQTDPLSHETTWTYYPGGQLETVTDANSHTTTYSYDDDNNLSTVTAPDSTVTTYSYDDNNNELTKEEANSHTTTYTYDDANRLASKELPGGQTWNYSYDNDGNLASMVDANGNATMTSGDGTTTYGYDNLDRLTSIDYSDSGTPDVTYSYDGDDDRTQMTDGGTVTYSYDNLDRLTGVTRSSHTFSYGYDANSNLTSETYPDSFAVAYTYTDDEQLHTAVSNSQTTTYSYDPAGNLTATALPSGNGYTETDSYDHAGRLTEVDNHNGATVLSDFAYTLDPVGNPTKTIRTGDINTTTTYGYDNLDRITSQCLQLSCPLSTDPKTSWTYDNVGNRLTQTTTGGTVTSTFNSDDRLTAAGSTSYSYDANGNQTAAGSNSFTYDEANRLASATVGATTTDYSYDGDGNRLTANDGTNTTNYSWDPAAVTPQLDTETNGSGTTIRDYLYGNQLISMTTGGGSPATYYYSFDALGSVADLTNSSGTTEITYSYDAWGNPTATPISGAPTNPIQYTAAYNDPTGLTHLGARQYDPTTGRFLQTDPANLATGSTYAYADNEPTAATDPSGLGSQGTFGVVNLSWIAGAFDAASDGYYSVRDARRALLEWETRHPGFLTGVQIAAFVGTGGDAADVDLPTPVVENPRLQNVVNDLYKGVSNPDRVGNGTTADAVRSEAETGQPTGGTFHTQKAQQYSNALTKLLSGGTLNPRDRIVAQSLLDDLQAALGNRP